MNTFALYCKSYRNDVDLIKRLLDSILLFNKDNIPFYISCPKGDIQIFKNRLGTTNYVLISDEEITEDNNSGWMGQQIVKTQFFKLEISENYLCLDSDTFFIKDFHIYDFMFNGNIPYTICHEHKDLFIDLEKFNIIGKLGFNPYKSFLECRIKIKEFFQNTYSAVYDFGPGPVIWSCDVWKRLDNIYKIHKLIEYCPSEFTWYGEYLIKENLFPIYPKQYLFKSYHYELQYDLDMKICNNIDILKKLYAKYGYLGIGIQSNWAN